MSAWDFFSRNPFFSLFLLACIFYGLESLIRAWRGNSD